MTLSSHGKPKLKRYCLSHDMLKLIYIIEGFQKIFWDNIQASGSGSEGRKGWETGGEDKREKDDSEYQRIKWRRDKWTRRREERG